MFKSVLVSALLVAASSVHAESINIGNRNIEITKVDRYNEGRMVFVDVYLKFPNPEGLNQGKTRVSLGCTLKTGTLINEHGPGDEKVEEVKIDPKKRDTSITNNLWFKYCQKTAAVSKKFMDVYSKYD